MESPPPSPLAEPGAWDLVAADYATEIVPVLENYAREAMRMAGVRPGMRVVDVAAGPGTLALLAARVGVAVSAVDFAPEMIARLRSRATQEGLTDIEATLGDGTALPFPDASFDAGFSLFGLMFFRDRAKGFRELHRVLKPGVRAVVSSWAPLERVPLLAAVFATLAALVPGPAGPPGGPPLTDHEAFKREMTAAGFTDVSVTEFSATADVPSMAEVLGSFVRASAPVALLRKKLGDQWPAVESQLRERLFQRFGAGPQRLVMPANLAVGTRPRG